MQETCYAGKERREKCPHAELAAENAVEKTFAILGVDVHNPQQVSQFQDSLRFGDKLRRTADKGIMPLFLTVAALIGAAFIAGMTYKGP